MANPSTDISQGQPDTTVGTDKRAQVSTFDVVNKNISEQMQLQAYAQYIHNLDPNRGFEIR